MQSVGRLHRPNQEMRCTVYPSEQNSSCGMRRGNHVKLSNQNPVQLAQHIPYAAKRSTSYNFEYCPRTCQYHQRIVPYTYQSLKMLSRGTITAFQGFRGLF